MKVNVWIVDKHKILKRKGKYDERTRLLEVKQKRLSRENMRFLVDPDHIYEVIGSRRKHMVFVDNAKRRSIPIKREKIIIEDGKKRKETVTENVEAGESFKVHSDDDVDLAIANKLDYHVESRFWRGMIQHLRMPVTTLLITMFAGYGIIRFVEWILTAIFTGAHS